jgi:hypothetical protein
MARTPRANLPRSLVRPSRPTPNEFLDALAAHKAEFGVEFCAGKPAGTICFQWQNPDGSVSVSRCDGNGNCVPPGA